MTLSPHYGDKKMRGKAEFKTMDVSIGKGIGTDTQNDLMDINKNIAKGFSELDEDIETKGLPGLIATHMAVRSGLGAGIGAGTGALASDKGKRKEGAKRGAAYGAVGGLVHPVPGGIIGGLLAREKNNEATDVKEEKGIKDKVIRAGKYLKREIEGEHRPVTFAMGTGAGLGVGSVLGKKRGEKEGFGMGYERGLIDAHHYPELGKDRADNPKYKELDNSLTAEKGVKLDNALKAIFRTGDLAQKAEPKRIVFEDTPNLGRKAQRYIDAMKKNKKIFLEESEKESPSLVGAHYLKKYKELDEDIETKSFKAVQEKIESEGYSPKVAGAILADKTRNASAAAKAKNPNLNKVKGSPKQYKELEDDIKVKGVISNIGKKVGKYAAENPIKSSIGAGAITFGGGTAIEQGIKKLSNNPDDDIENKGIFSTIGRKLVRPVKEANVVPDDIKAGLDRVSKYNRINTTLSRNGVGPAKNTIMANKQETGSHLTGLKPNADAYRGARKVQEGISIPVGGRRPNSYDKPLTKGVDSLIVED